MWSEALELARTSQSKTKQTKARRDQQKHEKLKTNANQKTTWHIRKIKNYTRVKYTKQDKTKQNLPQNKQQIKKWIKTIIIMKSTQSKCIKWMQNKQTKQKSKKQTKTQILKTIAKKNAKHSVLLKGQNGIINCSLNKSVWKVGYFFKNTFVKPSRAEYHNY